MISAERLENDREELSSNLEKLESHLARLQDAVKTTESRIASQRGAIEYASMLLQAARENEQAGPADQPGAIADAQPVEVVAEPVAAAPAVQPAPLPVEKQARELAGAMAKEVAMANGAKPR